jgi:hypothetical protein
LKLGPSWQVRLLVAETNETVAARHAADGVGHDLGRLGGCVLVLEKLDKNKLGDLGAEISSEDARVLVRPDLSVLVDPTFLRVFHELHHLPTPHLLMFSRFLRRTHLRPNTRVLWVHL